MVYWRDDPRSILLPADVPLDDSCKNLPNSHNLWVYTKNSLLHSLPIANERRLGGYVSLSHGTSTESNRITCKTRLAEQSQEYFHICRESPRSNHRAYPLLAYHRFSLGLRSSHLNRPCYWYHDISLLRIYRERTQTHRYLQGVDCSHSRNYQSNLK